MTLSIFPCHKKLFVLIDVLTPCRLEKLAFGGGGGGGLISNLFDTIHFFFWLLFSLRPSIEYSTFSLSAVLTMADALKKGFMIFCM